MGFILDMIIDSWRHKKISTENQKRQGVVGYRPSQVGGFVEPDSCYGNTLVSGGDATIRSEVINALCISAANAGLPVVVLHQGDIACENQLKNTFSGFSDFYLVNESNPIFDPIYGLTEEQIKTAIVDTAPKNYNISPVGGAYIGALTGTLFTKVTKIPLPSLYSMVKNDTVPQLLRAGSLPATVATAIQSQYTQGQKEMNSINMYINNLYRQCQSVLPKTRRDYNRCCTFSKVVASKGVLVLDVGSDINNLYIRLLVELFNDMLRNGNKFLVIVDNLAITDENGLKQFFLSQNNRISKAVIGEDIYSSLGCEEKLFKSLLGYSHKWFIFRHMSDDSALQWSKGIGTFKKIETSVNIGRGNTFGRGIGTGYIGTNSNEQYNTGETLYQKDEAKVLSSEIQSLRPRQGFVYTKANNELAFVSEFIK